MKHIERTKAGSFQYRRRVPRDVAGIISKREFKKKLGDTEREALRVWPQYHAQVERELVQARRQVALGSDPQTEREAYEAAQRWVQTIAPDAGNDLRDVLADQVAGRYAQDPETEVPIGASAVDRHAINLLRIGAASYRAPEPTVADALKLYLREKLGEGGETPDERGILRVRRDMGRIAEALGRPDPVLSGVTREDARRVRDYLLGRVKSTGERLTAATAQRELNTIRAVVSLAIAEHVGLPPTYENPFNNLTTAGRRGAAKLEGEGTKRDPLPPKVLSEVRKRLLVGANPELALLWRLLEGAGARLAEVSGLRAQDVVLSGPVGGDYPHIVVTWHENRRLKNQASVRHIPLVEDALEAAREALELPRQGVMLFPSYGRKGGL